MNLIEFKKMQMKSRNICNSIKNSKILWYLVIFIFKNLSKKREIITLENETINKEKS